MTISIIIPCYNEESNIIKMSQSLLHILKEYEEFEIIFIDDGSTDNSTILLQELSSQNSHFNFISFSRNFGHQNALKAGFDYAKGDCVISLDADFQHPIELIPEMIAKWQEGYQIVYTIREDNYTQNTFKKITSSLFYKSANFFSDYAIEPGTADFRLIDRQVVEVFKNIQETDLFFRGLIPWVGFRQYVITYQAHQRAEGLTKYKPRKMFNLALRGITSMSIKPLHLSTILGFIISFFSFLYALYALYIYFFTKNAVTGWTSLIICVLFIGGLQLIMLGVIGEYLGRLFVQNKKRPIYIIKKTNIKPSK
jgi:polyisoprenyl-phosphate glycosyltransferase